jgi:hypothetical protein
MEILVGVSELWDRRGLSEMRLGLAGMAMAGRTFPRIMDHLSVEPVKARTTRRIKR